jgi:hypothetical protein
MRPIAFRFFFIYFLLTIAPWIWLYMIPGMSFFYELYGKAVQWIVELFNTHLLHVKDQLNANGGGSGDTSFNWAQFYTYLLLSAFGCLVWTLIDRKRERYDLLDFFLKTWYAFKYVSLHFATALLSFLRCRCQSPI